MRVIWGMREMTVTSTETKNQAGKTWLTPESESGVVWCGAANQQIRRKRRGFKTDINHKLLSKYRTMDVRLGNDGWECLEPVNRAHFRPISRCNNKAPGLHLNFCEIFSLFIANLSKFILLRAECLLTSVRWENICQAEFWLMSWGDRRGVGQRQTVQRGVSHSQPHCQDTKLSSQGLPDRHRYVRLETQRRTKYHHHWLIAQSQYREWYPLIVLSEHSPPVQSTSSQYQIAS